MSVIGGVIANGVNVSSGSGSVDLSTTVILAPTASSRNVIQASTTAIVPLAVKLYTGSTANLQEWQNSAGTVLSKISSDGRFVFGSASNGATIDITGTDGTRFLNITDGYGTVSYQYGILAATKFYSSGLSLFGSFNVGANADITVVRNAAGIMQIKDGSTGNGSLILGAYTASTVALTVKGAASQSANLQEWQNSSGTVLLNVDKDGKLKWSSSVYAYEGGGYLYLNSASGVSANQAISAPYLITSPGHIYINDTVVGLGDTTSIGFTSDYYGSAAKDAGIARSAAGILKITDGSTGNGSLIVGAYSASTVALTVKAAASQTANIQEWQKSDGTVLTKITKEGWINYSSDAVSSNASEYQFGVVCTAGGGGSAFKVYLGAGGGYIGCSGTPILVSNSVGLDRLTLGEYHTGYKGLSLDEAHKIWFCDVYGNTNRNLAITKSGAGILKLTDGSTGNGSLILGAYTASTVALTVKGAASQSANIQEWQNSSGTVIAKVASNGTISSKTNFGSDLLSDFYNNRAYLWMNHSATRAVLFEGLQTDRTTLTVRPAASQTTNIQAWESSGGTVLTRIDKNGTLVTKVNSAPADGDLAANECSWYFDSTNGSAFVRFKGKTADGTVVTGSLALT